MRTFNFNFSVECHSDGKANIERVEQLLDLALQDLIYDDEFIKALDESQAVTIQLTQGNKNDK